MISSQPLAVRAGDAWLRGERWEGAPAASVVVLLHSGVADRRAWHPVAERLVPRLTLIAYDRRGFGDTGPATSPFSHLEDLAAVLDAVAVGPVWLAGSSAGGGLALDATVAFPHQVAGLVLFAPAVSGAPPAAPEHLDAATLRLDAEREASLARGDLSEVNRLDAWLWLDGPGQPEGRIGGAVRILALEMNAAILRNLRPQLVRPNGIQAWPRLSELAVPVTVVCGDLDVPFLRQRCGDLAQRLPAGRLVIQPGTAHAPYLEQPAAVAELLVEAITSP